MTEPDDLDNPVIMFKVLKNEYVDSFVNEGRLYMQTLGYFNKLEDKNKASRGDEFEGVDHVYQGNDVKLLLNEVSVTAQKVKLKIWNESNFDMNVYCMSAISVRDLIEANGKIEFSKKFLEFGDKVVFFYEQGLVDFLDRVEKSLKKNSLLSSNPHYHKFAEKVQYLDNLHSGALGIFKKYQDYSWQYEWRLAVNYNSKQEVYNDIVLGDLSGICSVIDTSQFVKNPIIIRNFDDVYS